jgi:hypothetical protein
MNRNYIAALALAILALPISANAAIDDMAKYWQIQGLRGIKSINYGIAYDADNKLTKTVSAELSGVGVPLKSVNFMKNDVATSLLPTEAQLKVFVNDREQDKCWVGLNIKQKCRLDRDPSITFDAQTYSIGTLSAKSNADAAVKDVCAQFVRDFKPPAN